MTNKKPQEQMERIRRIAEELGGINIYNKLPLRSLIFLNKKENVKRRKNTDWIEYFLCGFFYGTGV